VSAGRPWLFCCASCGKVRAGKVGVCLGAACLSSGPTRHSSGTQKAALVACFINMGVRFLSPLNFNVRPQMLTSSHWLLKPLAVVGALTLLIAAGAFAFANWPDSPDVEVLQTVESPNRDFVAIAATFMTGGAAGSCRNYVVVRQAEKSDLPKTHREVEAEAVFSSRCQSGVKLSWPRANGLHVRFTVPPGRSGTGANLQQLHGTLPVEVTYEIEA